MAAPGELIQTSAAFVQGDDEHSSISTKEKIKKIINALLSKSDRCYRTWLSDPMMLLVS